MAAAKISGIYEIVNTLDGKRYVGSSCNIKDRFYNHKYHLRKGTHRNGRLQRAWIKHGEQSFSFRVVMTCEVDELLVQEQRLLDELLPEYNLTPIAGRIVRSPESIERSAAKRRGVKTGPLSEAHRAAIAAAHIGRKLPDWHIEAIRAGKRGSKRPDMAGNRWGSYPKTDQTRQRLSEALKGKRKSEETRARMRAAWAKRKANSGQGAD